MPHWVGTGRLRLPPALAGAVDTSRLSAGVVWVGFGMAGLLGRGEDAGGCQPHSSMAAVLGEMRSRRLGTVCTHQSCSVATKQSRWWLVCRGRDSCQVKKELSDPEAWEQVTREAWQ